MRNTLAWESARAWVSQRARSHFPPAFAVACAIFFVVTAALSVRGASSTWDDPAHLVGGIAQWQTGEPRLNADHPPLARMLGALPVLFLDVPPVAAADPAAWGRGDLSAVATANFALIEDRLLWPGRLSMLVLSVLLAWLLYRWGSRLHGPEGSWVPLALFAFCPPLLANAPLVTTDLAAAAFIFASVFALRRYLADPRPATLLVTGLAVAAAFCSKHTALALIPLFLFYGLIALVSTKFLPFGFGRRLRVVVGGFSAIAAIVVLAIDAAYFFDGVFLTPAQYVERARQLLPFHATAAERLSRGWPAWLPVPLPFQYVSGVLTILSNVGERGHATWFLGQAGYGGWSNYPLMMLLIKLPLPTLALIGLGCAAALSRLRKDGGDFLFLVVPPAVLLALGAAGKMQIGIRHLLPIFPFLFLLGGYALRLLSFRWRAPVVAVLVGLSGVATVTVHPDHLMYFNFLGGGPDQGWRISVTGDDYGQGDAAVVRWLRERGIEEVAFGAFGWGNLVLHRAGIATRPLPCEDTGELVITHLGQLLLTYSREKTRCYEWMRLKEPDEKIGHSIFVYNGRHPKPLPPKDLALFSQALDLQLRRQLPEAIALYQQYLAKEPDYFQARFNLGCALMDSDRCAEAIPEFEKTLALWPGYLEAHRYLVTCFRQTGRSDLAERHEGLSGVDSR